MASEEQGICPKCGKVLTGAVEITRTVTCGVPRIIFRETPDRNWIQCDGCNLVVCKGCCKRAYTGFCDECLQKLQTAALSKTSAQTQNQGIG